MSPLMPPSRISINTGGALSASHKTHPEQEEKVAESRKGLLSGGRKGSNAKGAVRNSNLFPGFTFLPEIAHRVSERGTPSSVLKNCSKRETRNSDEESPGHRGATAAPLRLQNRLIIRQGGERSFER